MKTPRFSRASSFAVAVATLLAAGAARAQQADGTWTNTAPATLLTWSDTANWLDSIVADGTEGDATAYFDAINLTGPMTVQIDADTIITNLIVGDTVATSPVQVWSLTAAAANLILAGTSSPTITVDGSTALTIAAPITGSKGLIKAGSGTLILTNYNNYTGDTVITGGTLRLNNTPTIPNSNISISSGAFLDVADRDATVSGLWGAGTVTNSGSTAYLLSVGNNNQTSSFSGVIENGTGGGKLGVTKEGSGTLTLSGTSTYTGVTKINAGTLSVNTIGDGGVSGSLGAAPVDAANILFNTGTLQYSGDTASTNRGFQISAATVGTIDVVTSNLTISGSNATSTSGSLTKIGAGTLTLTGLNTYTGVTKISNGTLSVNTLANASSSSSIGAASSTASSKLVLDGGTLQYTGVTGSTNRGFTLNTGTISTIDVVTNNLTISGVGAGSGSLTKIGAGTLTLSGSNTYTGVTKITDGTLSVNTLANGGLNSNIGKSSTLAANLVFDGGTLQYTGSNVSTDRAFTITNSKVGTIDVVTNNLTITGASASTSGSLTKIGTGTLTLTGSNAYTGATLVSAGVLNIQNATALGTTAGGTSVTSGAALKIQGGITVGAEALTLNGTAVTGESNTGALRNISDANVWQGTVTLGSDSRINSDAGSLTFNTAANSITGSGKNLILGGASGGTVGGTITTDAGTLTKDGIGTWILSGASTYTGATSVSAGVLNIRNATALGTTAGDTSVTSGAALQIQGGITVGAEALTLNGTAVASESNTGALRNISDTNYWQGTVTLGSDSRINSDAGSLTFNTATNSITGSGRNLILGGVSGGAVGGTITTGSGTLTKDGAGTWILSGANTFTGVTTIQSGVLSINSIQDAGSATANALGEPAIGTNSIIGLANTGTLQYAGTGSTGHSSNRVVNLATTTGGAMTLDASGTSGTFALTGGVTSSGTSGTSTLTLTGTGLGSESGVIANGTSTNVTAMTKADTGTWTLSGTNTYTGDTLISGGTLQLGNGTTTGKLSTSSGISISSGANLKFNPTAATPTVQGTDFNSVISGSGNVIQAGGTVVLNGTNTYSGTTKVNAGVMNVTGSLASGSAVTVGGTGSSGTPTLAGNGTVNGATTIAAAVGGATVAGTYSPGDRDADTGASLVGVQTFGSTLTYQTGSIFEWQLNSNTESGRETNFDGVNIAFSALDETHLTTNKNLTINSGAIFSLVLGNSVSFGTGNTAAGKDFWWNVDRSWRVFDNATSNLYSTTSNFTIDAPTASYTPYYPSGSFSFNNTNGTLNWTAVPEPSSALAGMLLGAGLLRRRRK